MPTKMSALAAIALITALSLAGCAAEPAASDSNESAAASQTPTPEPTFAPGDVVDADQAAGINADTSDTTVAYPVGDTFVVVTWGKPIPPAVREAVNANVKAAVGPKFGTTTDVAENAGLLRDVQLAESTKLGGITIAAVACLQSFSTKINSFRPTWVISEPGPHGEYDSYQHAFDTAEAWQGGDQEGRRMYVLINNLGCKQ